MSIFGIRDSGPKIVQNGLGLWFDAAQSVSYAKRGNPTTGDIWYDRANGKSATINNGYLGTYFLWSPNNGGYFYEFASNDNYITINNPAFSNLSGITIQSVFMYEASQFEGPKFLKLKAD